MTGTKINASHLINFAVEIRDSIARYLRPALSRLPTSDGSLYSILLAYRLTADKSRSCEDSHRQTGDGLATSTSIE